MNKKILIFFIFNTLLFSHPGRLDSSGGHWNRKTGTYHYHRARSANYSTSNVISTSTTPKKTVVKKKQVLMKEDEVYTRLLWLGFSGENAIKNFQKANNLTPDGIAGPKTINLIKELTKNY
ncbi:YHYH domain-containing protein [Fusobacterium mortiferum]|uniref:YHYH domain-containing protein n=1 Tax=Fusobacterium mortiferum TaxID=850 RepID=UPI001F46BFE9|nr:YHYH domain-containing protein [Fusobacterium mortiferum]MCF2628947.1 YHYH domain-containing protein [Fusobacterium mortiferum]